MDPSICIDATDVRVSAVGRGIASKRAMGELIVHCAVVFRGHMDMPGALVAAHGEAMISMGRMHSMPDFDQAGILNLGKLM